MLNNLTEETENYENTTVNFQQDFCSREHTEQKPAETDNTALQFVTRPLNKAVAHCTPPKQFHQNSSTTEGLRERTE